MKKKKKVGTFCPILDKKIDSPLPHAMLSDTLPDPPTLIDGGWSKIMVKTYISAVH